MISWRHWQGICSGLIGDMRRIKMTLNRASATLLAQSGHFRTKISASHKLLSYNQPMFTSQISAYLQTVTRPLPKPLTVTPWNSFRPGMLAAMAVNPPPPN
jgi:hypothetical protein